MVAEKIGESVEFEGITYTVGIDIYCDFEEPTDPEVIAKLEKRFSHIYGNPRTMEDICLDGIVMAPDEISLID